MSHVTATSNPRGAEAAPPSIRSAAKARPSVLYAGHFWEGARRMAAALPEGLASGFGATLGRFYGVLNRRRFKTVYSNLMPVFDSNEKMAGKAARRLFGHFGRKLVDLWRYESGLSVDHLFSRWTGLEHLENALAQKRGLLIVTPHLGNWEFGAPLLAKKGIQLLVITLSEPGAAFTEARRVARARWGIETLVIGDDPFAFVEVLRRLEEGKVVALLVDRPGERSAIDVNLFNHRFSASVAPAELARASGCSIVPVYLPRDDQGYEAHVLPTIDYDRVELRSLGARQDLTQRMMNAFAPVIRQKADQWYHFIPIWK